MGSNETRLALEAAAWGDGEDRWDAMLQLSDFIEEQGEVDWQPLAAGYRWCGLVKRLPLNRVKYLGINGKLKHTKQWGWYARYCGPRIQLMQTKEWFRAFDCEIPAWMIGCMLIDSGRKAGVSGHAQAVLFKTREEAVAAVGTLVTKVKALMVEGVGINSWN